MKNGRPKSLPWLTNSQFNEVEDLIKKSSTHLNECPTCGAKAKEVAPGVIEWPEGRTYRLGGKDHPCNCEEQESLFWHYMLARIPQEYTNLDVDDYFGDEKAMEAVLSYLENWDNLRKHGMGMGFYSTNQGTGKTFLAMMIARHLVKRGESVYCVYFSKVVNFLDKPPAERLEEENRLRDCTVLVLDEIGRPVSGPQRDFWASKFEELIRHRSNYNKVTILTTNLTPAELEEIYPRIYSLLAAKERSIKVKGDDARKAGVYSVNEELAFNGESRPLT